MDWMPYCKNCEQATYNAWYGHDVCGLLMREIDHELQKRKEGYTNSVKYAIYDKTTVPPPQCPYILEILMREESDKTNDLKNPLTDKVRKIIEKPIDYNYHGDNPYDTNQP